MTMTPPAVLMVRGGPKEGSTIPLSEGTVVLGRSALNDIVVDEPSISRQHASIRGGADGFWISDLGSRNGTFVNGTRIGSEPQRLRNWDRVELGGMSTHWVFMESQQTIAVTRPTQPQP